MTAIASILVDNLNVNKAALRSYLAEKLEGNGEIETLVSGIDGVTAHTFLRPGFTTPVTVGMLGGPEANFGINIRYDGGTHYKYDEDEDTWYLTISPTAGPCFQYIPAGLNAPTSPDIWSRTGTIPWQIDADGNQRNGGARTSVPSPWNLGSAIELNAPGVGVQGANKTVNLMANWYFDGASKFAASGRAAVLYLAEGAMHFTNSTGAGVAAGDAALMVDQLVVSSAGVMTVPVLGGSTTWVTGDKYVVIDSNGVFHRSATGPGS